MEEIAHSFLGHSPSVLTLSGESRYRDFNKKQETEAYGVGAAVLLPWRLFFPVLNGGANCDQLSEAFDVTRDLIQYRIKVCGASSLYSKRQKNNVLRSARKSNRTSPSAPARRRSSSSNTSSK